MKEAGLTKKGGPIERFYKENPTLAVKQYVSATPLKRNYRRVGCSQ